MKMYTFKWRIPYNAGMEGQRFYKSSARASSQRTEAMKRIYEMGADDADSFVSEVFELELDEEEA